MNQAYDICTNSNHEPKDAREALALLKGAVAQGSPLDHYESAFGVVEKTLQTVLDEHAGMGEELLAAYELIGVVFEVTRRLSIACDESQVLDVFVDGLQRSYVGHEIFISLNRESEFGSVYSGGGSIPGWVDEAVDRAAKELRVTATDAPHGDHDNSIVQVLISPVVAGDDFVCAIIVGRHAQDNVYRACDMTMVEALCNYCGDVIRNHRLVLELQGISVSMVRALVNAVDQKDEYTSGHSIRVGFFSLMLGSCLKLTAHEMQMLQWSALLHDVGKIGIRDDVLKKEGKLTDEEFTHMKEHATRSYMVVKEIPKLTEALPGVLHHHEKYNGNGYPCGLKGLEIPLQARIIQIADIFDALTSNRSYRGAYSWREALEILERESGETCDPELTTKFMALMRDRLESDDQAWSVLIEESELFLQETDTIGNSVGILQA